MAPVREVMKLVPDTVCPATPAGESLAFRAIYEAHFDFVWRCLGSMGVDGPSRDDAAQEVFVVVYRRLSDFRGEGKLRTWLYGITRNVAANHRRSRRRKGVWPPVSPRVPDPDPNPEERLRDRDAARFVRDFAASLDDKKRDVFVLGLIEQLSMPEVASVLGIPLNTAYTRLRAVRAEFKTALQRAGEPHDR